MAKRKAWIGLALGVSLTACYHVTVDTGRPAETIPLYEPWATSYFWGLIPPRVVTSAVRCGDGISRVETRHSVLNVLATIVTVGIYSPMEIRVVCAATP